MSGEVRPDGTIDLPVLPPPPITLDELLNSFEALKQKEAADKALLEQIGLMSHETLKQKLLTWAAAGFPNAYEILQVPIIPPRHCSDGVTRSLIDYAVFCSGKFLYEHIAVLQEKVVGVSLGYTNSGPHIAIVVTKG